MGPKIIKNRCRNRGREKVRKSDAPDSVGIMPDYRFSTKNGPKRYPKNDEKVEAEKVLKNDAKGSKGDAKCSQNGSQNLRTSIETSMPKRDGNNIEKTLNNETVES